MQAVYYSEKSIAVFGDTKPWAANLRALGGKFNGNLGGRPGWIFQRAKEGELMQFIVNANAGVIQAAPQPTTVAQPTMVPQGFMQPAMTPQDAMARLTIAQPALPQAATPTIPFPQVPLPGTLPTIQPIVRGAVTPQLTLAVNVPKPLSPTIPKPFVPLPTQPTVVNHPNLFTAGDGLAYQVVMYTLPLPQVNQRVTLSIGENNIEYRVSAMEKTSPPYDSILITRLPAEDVPQVEDAEEQPTSKAILMNGEWKVFCMQDEHRLIFHPMVQ
ncbi:Hypothetical protein HVR_LOCUS1031 [uncultured virus]|nr:Hypothetical protein HVR_LOCUS1031 [uncultured virus]